MQLLPKTKLKDALNAQKKSEIDAGLFLAKKVDALRESLADEQKVHDEEVARMNKETQDLLIEQNARKAVLAREVRNLEDRKKELSVPLDEAWDKVNMKSEENRKKEEELEKREANIIEKENTLNGEIEQTQAIREDLEYQRSEVSKNLQITKDNKEKSVVMLHDNYLRRREIEANLEEENVRLINWDHDLQYRERDMQNKIRSLSERSVEVTRLEAILEAKQRTLLANMKNYATTQE